MKYAELTEQIIRAFYKVYNTLGYGFLEKVYENALTIELVGMGLSISRQKRIQVYYEGKIAGDYYADIIVEDRIILELKANELLHPDNEKQLINYLKASDTEVGLLLNFGKPPQFKRKIFDNDKKTGLTTGQIKT
jgi:GxxExxY protein